MTICTLLGAKANTADVLALLTSSTVDLLYSSIDQECSRCSVAVLTWETLGTGANSSRCVEPIGLPYGHTTHCIQYVDTQTNWGVPHCILEDYNPVQV